MTTDEPGTLLDADFALTGVSRLVTLALPGTLPDASGRLSVIEQGALAALNGRIVWVGAERDLAARVRLSAVPERARLDAGNHAVLPGFVDSHTHFIFAGSRADEFQLRHAGVSYEEIARRGGGIVNTVRATRAASHEELLRLGRARLASLRAHGTTTVEGKTGYGLDIATEERCLDVMRELGREPGSPHVVPTFLGAHTLPPEFRGSPERRDEYVRLVREEMLPRFAGLARFCDVFCEATAFTPEETRAILGRAKELGYALKLHANQLGASGGAGIAAELGAVSADHLDFATDAELDQLRAASVVATLLPGCSFSLATPYPAARRFYDHGLEVALATDFNPGTCYCENMQMMIALAVSAMGMSLAEALRAATMGGAAALGMRNEVGSLEPGKLCDLIVMTSATESDLAYHFGVNLVQRTLVAGQTGSVS
jgi:imidazolonepropionase